MHLKFGFKQNKKEINWKSYELKKVGREKANTYRRHEVLWILIHVALQQLAEFQEPVIDVY